MTKGDKILISAIVIISLLFYVIIYMTGSRDGDKYISVQVNGTEFKRLTFTSKNDSYKYKLDTDGGLNIIEVKGDKVRMIEADCPDKLCVHQGYISKVGEVLVCIPNKVVVEIKSDDSEKELDGINYWERL